MACEDFPCCGHESGCCPRYDSLGQQLEMICLCGARLPVGNRYSICETCLNEEMEEAWGGDFNEDMDGDHDSAMTSAGWGTDEDYCHDTPMFEDYYGGE